MIRTNLFDPSDSHHIAASRGCFSVLEYERDLSVSPADAQEAYFASQMNVRKRQLIAKVDYDAGIIAQAGAMQLMLGDISVSTNVKGAGDLMKKLAGAAVTKETAIKPLYTGCGTMVLEPTFRYIILEDLSRWESGIVIEDGMFLACTEDTLYKVTSRTNLSSALLGHEGLFNTALYGTGCAAFESPVPQDELILIELEDDTVKIDGNMAIAWSAGLEFTVERTARTLIGSAVTGEGLVNVYRGSGRILAAPIENNRNITTPDTRRLPPSS